MNSKMKKTRLTALLTALCLLSGGCAAPVTGGAGDVSLPPYEASYTAPADDAGQSYSAGVTFFLPSLSGARLIAVPETMTLSAARPPYEAVCRALLAHESGEEYDALHGGALSLASVNPLEISGDVATVNLAPSALQLDHDEQYMISQAIANTLCALSGVRYVNVLISGAQPGLDIAASVPTGCLQSNAADGLDALLDRVRAQRASASRRATVTAALYFPALAGKGILCEARPLAFDGTAPGDMIKTLLEALSDGADTLACVPRCPDLVSLLKQTPTVREQAGERTAVVDFTDAFNDALIESGVTRSVMIASIVYTLTTFMPALAAVEITVGSEKITSVTPLGLYENAGMTIAFENGLMRRADFAAFLLSNCTLYFADAQGALKAAARPVPYHQAENARYLVSQLMLGPQPYDSVSGLSAVMPEGLRDADLIGLKRDGTAQLLNFSDRLITLSEGMDAAAERRMVYAVVNTLAQLRAVKSVAFFIMGEQPDTFSGALYLPGEFLPDASL